MANKKISLLILAAFVVGMLMLIYVHFIFSKNNDQLISGNQKLMEEVTVSSQLKDLEKYVISMESIVKGTIVTNDAGYFKGLEKNVEATQTNLNKLQKITDDDSSARYIDELDTLVQHKLLYDKNVLEVFRAKGKYAAEKMFASHSSSRLTDSIVTLIHKIDNTRKKHFAQAMLTIEKSSKKAQLFISLLILSVLAGGAMLFWYIINIIRKQGLLIRQLHISEKKVRESAHIKENFMANMSHEIRTPMNAILGFTNLLQQKKLDEDAAGYVQTIKKSGENLLGIINDILDLSKIEAGMMRIEAAPFSIRGLTHSVEVMFADKSREKNIKLSTQIDEAVPDTLNGDAMRLTQILVNLIGNAIKFTEQGSINIHISNEGIEKDILKTGITVADTGIGINPQKLQQVFGRFQQADDAVTRKYGGTGLGLSIVNDLVKLQNGSIQVQSQPGKGTSFHIMIPYRVIANGTDEPITKELPATGGFNFKDVVVLVAEDNEVNQNLIKHLFKNWNLQYDLTQNGREAVEKLKNKNYNLVLMDIQMPEMDGYTATSEIRNVLKNDVPIIAMTAHALAGEKEKCISYGMNEYISKPINIEKLYNLLTQFAKIKTMPPTNGISNYNQNSYQHISLNYMKEVSSGDTGYEKDVTMQFIEMVPQQLDEIEKAWKSNNLQQVRQLAHNFKTTVSVMGLNEKLQPFLNRLEYENPDEEMFYTNFTSISTVCHAAVKEAGHFLTTL